MIECKRCGRQYVVQTGQTLKKKFRDHNREVNTLHKHFRGGTCRGVNNMRVQVLHVLDGTSFSGEQTELELKRIKTLWIDRLMYHIRQDS